jgi:hypothetical protein
VVLATQKFFVVIQFERQADLVARRAELGRLVKRFQECLLVKPGFGFDELFIDPLQHGAVTEREGVM